MSQGEKVMNIVKNLLIAATMGLAAFASWAVTDFPEPAIEAPAQR
jgi:hypothetical protein